MPPGQAEPVAAVVERLRETVGHLDGLVVALRGHAGPDPDWPTVQWLAEQAVESCRAAHELIAAASRMLGDAATDSPSPDGDEGRT